MEPRPSGSRPMFRTPREDGGLLRVQKVAQWRIPQARPNVELEIGDISLIAGGSGLIHRAQFGRFQSGRTFLILIPARTVPTIRAMTRSRTTRAVITCTLQTTRTLPSTRRTAHRYIPH